MTPKKILFMLALLVITYLFIIFILYKVHKTKDITLNSNKGLKVWLQHKCYSCHKIYGLGGFLAPDLTNVTNRLSFTNFSLLITEGTINMPKFLLSKLELLYLFSFFKSLEPSKNLR